MDFKKECKECGTKLVLKIDDFKFTENDYKKFKKKFNFDMPIPKGYRCSKCGACYDENGKRQNFNISKGSQAEKPPRELK